jgi:hypothetical protein
MFITYSRSKDGRRSPPHGCDRRVESAISHKSSEQANDYCCFLNIFANLPAKPDTKSFEPRATRVSRAIGSGR